MTDANNVCIDPGDEPCLDVTPMSATMRLGDLDMEWCFPRFRIALFSTEDEDGYHFVVDVFSDKVSVCSYSPTKHEFLHALFLAHTDQNAAFAYIRKLIGYPVNDSIQKEDQQSTVYNFH